MHSPAVGCEVRLGEKGPLEHKGSANGYPVLSIYYELF